MLPVQWLLSITVLFNSIFTSGFYPSAWRLARLFTIFKRGDPLLPANCRDINVMNIIAKLYDMVLCNRLMQWFPLIESKLAASPKEDVLNI